MPAATGLDMKFYQNTGTIGTPVWTEISAIGDLNVSDFSLGLGELKHRGSVFVKNLPTLFQSITVDFNMIHGLEADNFDSLRTQFFARTPSQFAIMDGDITTEGSEGLVLPALIKQMPWNQALEDVSAHDFQLATGLMFDDEDAEVDPTWLVVEGA